MAEGEIGEDLGEYVDEVEDEIDESAEAREAQLDAYASSYPRSPEQQSIYTWFWKVVRLKQPFQLVKVGRVGDIEIGESTMPIREAMNLWVLGHFFHHKTFGNYFAQLAKITSATSMARDGWFMNLSISQRRIRERARNIARVGRPGISKGWRVFRKKLQSNQQPVE